jgi:hypothetical protein
MILSEKLIELTSVSTPLTKPVARFEGAGKPSCLWSTSAMGSREFYSEVKVTLSSDEINSRDVEYLSVVHC